MVTGRKAVFVAAQGRLAIDAVVLADTVWTRFLGLMGSAPLGRGRGLFLAPCGAVHTCFMRYALDLIFVSRDYRVVRVVESVRPWRVAFGGRAAWGVLELQAGWFSCRDLAPGARLEFLNPAVEPLAESGHTAGQALNPAVEPLAESGHTAGQALKTEH